MINNQELHLLAYKKQSSDNIYHCPPAKIDLQAWWVVLLGFLQLVTLLPGWELLPYLVQDIASLPLLNSIFIWNQDWGAGMVSAFEKLKWLSWDMRIFNCMTKNCSTCNDTCSNWANNTQRDINLWPLPSFLADDNGIFSHELYLYILPSYLTIGQKDVQRELMPSVMMLGNQEW